jgi:5'-3' exonuclease
MILLLDFLNFFYKGAITFGKPKPLEENIEPKEDNTIIYNFFRNFRALVETLKPNKVIVCLEGQNSFRKKIYPEYKANRIIKTGDVKSDKKLVAKQNILRQAEITTNLLDYLPVYKCYADTFEADDVLYSLANNLRNEDVVIVSNDNDLLQILQKKHLNKIRIYNSSKKVFATPPKHFHTLFKVLFGDVSDNIPRLVGKKTAEKIVQSPELLKEFLTSPENLANFNLNMELVELKLIPDEQLIFTDYNKNYNKLKEEFEKMEFVSFFNGIYWDRFVSTFEGLN